MSLPTTIDYVPPVPPARSLPASRAPWTLEASRAVVLVHDLQQYFLRPFAPEGPALVGALAGAARIVRAARAAGVPVVYTAQTGDQVRRDRGLQGDLWGAGMSAIGEHTQIHPDVAPTPEDTVLVKHRYSAFARSDLAGILERGGRDQLVVVGVYAHIGVTATAFDAFQREVHPFVVADAVADLDADAHARALDLVAGCCGVVTLVDDVVATLEEAVAPEVAPAAVTGAGTPGGTAAAIDARLLRALGEVLGTEGLERALTDRTADLFTLGLTSLRSFDLLDELADLGVEIDLGTFTRRPTLAHLLEHVEVAGASGVAG